MLTDAIAALLHGYGWQAGDHLVELGPGIHVGPFRASPVQRAYEKLCARRGVDGGEPLEFQSYLLFTPGPVFETVYEIDYGDPYSVVDRAANMFVIATASPIGLARILWFGPHQRRVPHTEVAWRIGEWTWPIERPWPLISTQICDAVRTMWAVSEESWNRTGSVGRVNNAVTYFQHAWRAHHIDQACLSLAVAVEVLFAPHSQSETTHQIAFNFSRFLGDGPDSRERLFRQARSFYNVRSTIVHGGRPDFQAMVSALVEMFPLIATALRQILLQSELCRMFDNEKERKRLLNSFLFA